MDIHKIINLVPGIVYQFRLRPDGSACVPYASEAAREIYRLDPAELREDASQVFIHVHPDDLESHLASILASARDLTPWQNEYRLKFDDGTVRWLYGNALPQREADGSTLWHGFITDITGRKNSEERLRQSEEKLRAYLDNISDTIWLIDANLNMAYVSPSVTRLLGVLPEELIGRPSALVIHPHDMDVINDAQRYVMEHPGEPHTIQYRVSHKDGRWIHVESTGVNMLGNPLINGVLVTMRDITERKNIENELKQTKERYDFATEIGKVGTWDWNPVTGELIWSDETFRLMELAPGSVTPSYELFLGKVHADDRVFLDSAVQAALCDKKQYVLDCRIVSDSGEELTCHVNGKVEFDAKGQPIRMLGTIQDITDRKRGEERLRQSEANQRAILDNSPYLTWLKDTEGRYLKVNKAYADYARLKDAQQAIGMTDFDLWPRDLAEKYRADDVEVMASRQQKRFEEPSIDGEQRHWVETFKSPVIDESGHMLGTVGFARDITERKRAEEQIRNLAFYDELTQLPNRRLLDDRLRQAMAASKRSGLYGALMFLDLDNFKPLNDTYGHDVGDSLLVEAARRITGCVRKADTVSRFGGDEFVVMLGELDADRTGSIAQASIVAEKIRTILAEPYVLQFHREGHAETIVEHHCTSSIGVALFISHEASPENVLKWADMAMYQAKEGGRNLIRFFNSES